MKKSKLAKVLVLGASLGFGLFSTASMAGRDCCYDTYRMAMRGCAAAGNSTSYCESVYSVDLAECYQGTGVFIGFCWR